MNMRGMIQYYFWQTDDSISEIQVEQKWQICQFTNFIFKLRCNQSTIVFNSIIHCHKIHNFLRIWSHLLKKSLMENFIFCAVISVISRRQLSLSKQSLKCFHMMLPPYFWHRVDQNHNTCYCLYLKYLFTNLSLTSKLDFWRKHFFIFPIHSFF